MPLVGAQRYGGPVSSSSGVLVGSASWLSTPLSSWIAARCSPACCWINACVVLASCSISLRCSANIASRSAADCAAIVAMRPASSPRFCWFALVRLSLLLMFCHVPNAVISSVKTATMMMDQVCLDVLFTTSLNSERKSKCGIIENLMHLCEIKLHGDHLLKISVPVYWIFWRKRQMREPIETIIQDPARITGIQRSDIRSHGAPEGIKGSRYFIQQFSFSRPRLLKFPAYLSNPLLRFCYARKVQSAFETCAHIRKIRTNCASGV